MIASADRGLRTRKLPHVPRCPLSRRASLRPNVIANVRRRVTPRTRTPFFIESKAVKRAKLIHPIGEGLGHVRRIAGRGVLAVANLAMSVR